MRPEIEHEVQAAGQWPNVVGILRNVRLSDDLSQIKSRRVRAIKVYHNNDVALSLSVDSARDLATSLLAAVEAATSGPLGDSLEAPE